MNAPLFLLLGSVISFTPTEELSEQEFARDKQQMLQELRSFQSYVENLSLENLQGTRLFEKEEDPEDPFLTPIDPPSTYDPSITEFENLPIQEWEKQVIAFIVTEMAEKNVFELLLEKREMERKGKKINHVHPLRFIGYVCSDLTLKKAVRTFRKNPFKWDNFINGFAGRIREEHGRSNLLRFIPSFSRYLQADEATILNYLEQNDCDGLVRYLISI